ncbi:MAG TPA: NF038122 family metalloprotease, partial [Bryobacteraceae bacterium]|nr:NF038122 family metalloprotease [Bryobacteraceae bacterium]
SDPNAAAIEGVINSAIQAYQTTYSNPINVTIKFQSMNSGLGQSNTTLYKLSYQSFYDSFKTVATTSGQADQLTALANLPNSTNNPVTGSTFINIKTADIRALGIPGGPFPPGNGFDGIIGLNTHITDVGSPGTSGTYSLLATAEHEIDEVLGLGSDVAGTGFFADPAPQDLYRYTAGGSRNFTGNGGAVFFSIDGGTTDLAQFNNSNNGADYGDWLSNPLPPATQPKVQDAFATPGAHPALSTELTALDVIGYTQSSPLPEPSTTMLLGSGVVVAGLWKRLRARI